MLWRYTAPNPLQDVVAALLEFSNNFIANQLMLSMGAKVYGPPGTMEKGLRALQTYYTSVLGIKTGRIAEASGLSRDNRISADAMLHILDHFQSYYQLMRQEGRQWYKTGTLRGIHTRAGYLNCSNGECYRFVVMINTPGKRTDRIMRMIEQALR
jgi:D-alanyl-D-alanine carboxypeptidase/D-alanyl-D-alanine-endopeptidase (penicillin-binding protein 4)